MLRGTLFIKVFLGFWLVLLAVLLTWTITINYFEAQPDFEGPRDGKAAPPRFLLQLIYGLQNSPYEELGKLVRQVRQRHRLDVFLIDRNGEDLFGRELTPAVEQLAGQLGGRRRRAMVEGPQGRIAGHIIHRSDVGPLRAVMIIPPPRRPLLRALQHNFGLRLGLAVLVSGLVCYGLSRLMTGRLKQLQLASRKLAQGDLDTRIKVRDSGGDETDELARDFNTMAGQLQQKIQAQKRLLHDVSHELRSPLARLRLALALAEKDADNSGQHLRRIERETEHLDDLIGQLLDVPETQLPMDEHLDLVVLLQELCGDASFEGQAAGKSVDFNTDLDTALVATHGDLLHKGLGNILRNAVTYTADNSRVSARLSRDDSHYIVRVQDQGPGVPEQELSRLFDEFYRVDTARTRESGGYGLGLAIARRAVLQHGGSITAHNTAAGLAVEVRLPISPDI